MNTQRKIELARMGVELGIDPPVSTGETPHLVSVYVWGRARYADVSLCGRDAAAGAGATLTPCPICERFECVCPAVAPLVSAPRCTCGDTFANPEPVDCPVHDRGTVPLDDLLTKIRQAKATFTQEEVEALAAELAQEESAPAVPPLPPQCQAEEWIRDGRGLWAQRSCLEDVGHTCSHHFSPWRYNVRPILEAALAAAEARCRACHADIEPILDRMRAFADGSESGYAVDSWADEIADALAALLREPPATK